MPEPSAPTLAQVLEEGRRDVVDTLRSIPPALASTKPAPDRWSPLDCIEHVITVEHRFLGWITTGTPIEARPSSEKEQQLTGRILDRSTKAQAPEAVHPTGKYPSVEEAIADFNRARDISLQVARSRGTELYSVGVNHPRFGAMNGVELLLLMSGHARRHAAQIRETVAALQS